VSTPGTASKALPRRIRVAAVLCLVLSGLTGLSAASEAMGLGQLSEAREAGLPSSPALGDPKVLERMVDAQISALESMRELRALVLGALSVACAFIFVSAARLLRPAGMPLESMRQVLGGAALVAAVLRTVDGAQWAAVVKQIAQAMMKAGSQLPGTDGVPLPPEAQALFPMLLTGLIALHTALVAGSFLLLGQYFRSERVRSVISAQDQLTG
jgi:hypothetical protein